MIVAAASIAALFAGARLARKPLGQALARRHVARAEQKIGAGDDSGALVELSSALEADPLNAQARLLTAEAHLRRHQLEAAFLHLQAYTEAFPDDAKGWADLAQVRVEAAQPEQAEAALTQALSRAPDRSDLRLLRAELRLKIGRFHGALVDAEAVEPREPRAASALSTARARLTADRCAPPTFEAGGGDAATWPGKLGGMIREFLEATHRKDWVAADGIARRARDDYPLTMLAPWLDGMSSLRFGDLETAERSFRKALEIAPRSHRPISNLIAIWSKERGPLYTGDQLVKLADVDRSFAYPLPIAAAAYVEGGQPSKAEPTIRRMFAAMPSAPDPFREVARFQMQLDRPSDAIATAQQGLARFPRDAALLVQEGRAYLALGDRDSAAGAFEAAIAATPDDQAAAAELARLLVARKDAASRARALALVRDLTCDAPADADVIATIGAVLLQSDDAQPARTWLLAAKERAPESPRIRYQLAVASAKLGDTEAARRELNAALTAQGGFDEEADARRLLQELTGPRDAARR